MLLRCLSLLFLLTASVFTTGAASLDALVKSPALWTMKQADFMEATQELGFEWTSIAKDSARSNENELTLFGLPIVEAIARFDSESLTELTVIIYARGDAGNLIKAEYEGVIKGAVDALNRETGVKFTPRGKDARNVVKADGIIWRTPLSQYLLEYSATKEMKTRAIPFRAEFVRLEITPPPKAAGLLTTTTGSGSKKFDGAKQVKRDTLSGDVLIPGVPMVDQGQKGYCVVASVERVMRYYGLQVDANELAQIANSDAKGGTSSQGMLDALKKMGGRFKMRIREHEEIEVRQILGLIKDYNRVAKKAGSQELPDQGAMLDLGIIYSQMKPEILKEVRTKSRAEIARFQREVQQHIDTGIPLLWSVQLGMIKEPGIPQNGGGHMRLIIGYNSKTNEIIFSDSWGAGHEQKRMPIDDAWTITVTLSTIEPF